MFKTTPPTESPPSLKILRRVIFHVPFTYYLAESVLKLINNYDERRKQLKKLNKTSEKVSKRRIALSPEARENQMISLAIDLAEKQLMDGTASSQVITHFLKLGSSKERIEKEILEKQKTLISAKTEAIQSNQKIEELYDNALRAMKKYTGEDDDEEENIF